MDHELEFTKIGIIINQAGYSLGFWDKLSIGRREGDSNEAKNNLQVHSR